MLRLRGSVSHDTFIIALSSEHSPDSKVHGANMAPIWGRQDPGGPHDGPKNFAIWEHIHFIINHHNETAYVLTSLFLKILRLSSLQIIHV